jgi:hypothetical protein
MHYNGICTHANFSEGTNFRYIIRCGGGGGEGGVHTFSSIQISQGECRNFFEVAIFQVEGRVGFCRGWGGGEDFLEV